MFVSDLIVQCFPMAQDKDDSVDSLMKSEIRGKVCQASYDEWFASIKGQWYPNENETEHQLGDKCVDMLG